MQGLPESSPRKPPNQALKDTTPWKQLVQQGTFEWQIAGSVFLLVLPFEAETTKPYTFIECCPEGDGVLGFEVAFTSIAFFLYTLLTKDSSRQLTEEENF